MITIFAPLIEWVHGFDRRDQADQLDTIGSWNSLARSYLAAGQPAQAIPLYKRTLADCERALGAKHPNTLRSRNNLAMSYQAAGQTAKAIPLLERTLGDCERVLGADHPDTKAARENLAALRGLSGALAACSRDGRGGFACLSHQGHEHANR